MDFSDRGSDFDFGGENGGFSDIDSGFEGSNKKISKRFSYAILITSTVIGIIMAISGYILYKSSMSKILTVGIYFSTFTILLGIVIAFVSGKRHIQKNLSFSIIAIIVISVVTLGIGSLLEFIYEIDKEQQAEQKNGYVFLIDNSGSMDSNDERMERYNSLERIIHGLDDSKNVGIYTFESDVDCVIEYGSMRPSAVSISDDVKSNQGETSMIKAIRQALADTKDTKDYISFIILTDGEPSDNGFLNWHKSKAVKECVKRGVTVSSVGFGSPDDAFLKNLADSTGGVYVFSDNLDSLYSNLQTAVETQSEHSRDLIGYRADYKSSSVLYTIMRIFFLMIIGMVITVLKCIAVGDPEQYMKIGVVSLILCTAASVLVEILCAVSMPIIGVHLIMCVLFAATPAYEKDVIYNFSSIRRITNRPGEMDFDIDDRLKESDKYMNKCRFDKN